MKKAILTIIALSAAGISQADTVIAETQIPAEKNIVVPSNNTVAIIPTPSESAPSENPVITPAVIAPVAPAIPAPLVPAVPNPVALPCVQSAS